MNTLVTSIIVLVMLTMSVVPLFVVMYLGNERSRVGLLVLTGSLISGAILGTALTASA